VRRGEPPFQGSWALPGGFVRVGDTFHDQGEGLEAAARRELIEETGLELHAAWLEQVGAFGEPYRDPRMRVISVAWAALVRPTLAPYVRAGTDAADVRWWPVRELPELAFDHAHITAASLAHVRRRIEGSAIAFELVPDPFTVAELHAAWEAVLGEPIDPANFRRRFRGLVSDGVIHEAPGQRATATRPAQVWRFRAPGPA
jgi:8-oxo-dGTP diphosphatase